MFTNSELPLLIAAGAAHAQRMGDLDHFCQFVHSLGYQLTDGQPTADDTPILFVTQDGEEQSLHSAVRKGFDKKTVKFGWMTSPNFEFSDNVIADRLNRLCLLPYLTIIAGSERHCYRRDYEYVWKAHGPKVEEYLPDLRRSPNFTQFEQTLLEICSLNAHMNIQADNAAIMWEQLCQKPEKFFAEFLHFMPEILKAKVLQQMKGKDAFVYLTSMQTIPTPAVGKIALGDALARLDKCLLAIEQLNAETESLHNAQFWAAARLRLAKAEIPQTEETLIPNQLRQLGVANEWLPLIYWLWTAQDESYEIERGFIFKIPLKDIESDPDETSRRQSFVFNAKAELFEQFFIIRDRALASALGALTAHSN